jgi:hypothetical protein
VRKAEIPGPEPSSLEQQLAAVLARADEPLLAREVQERLLGDADADAPSVPTIRGTLVNSGLFTSPTRYRWQLGAYRAPRR